MWGIENWAIGVFKDRDIGGFLDWRIRNCWIGGLRDWVIGGNWGLVNFWMFLTGDLGIMRLGVFGD